MTHAVTPERISIPRGFKPVQRDLILAMAEDGWTGRLSNNGHMIMRAPDGRTTASVSPKPGSPRNLVNQQMPYRRWKRAQDC